MTPKEEILQRLKALKPEIRSRYRAKKISLFGSFVRTVEAIAPVEALFRD